MPRASAPSKIILSGEHAVVYGEPAIALAAGLRTIVEVEPSDGPHTTVNGYKLSGRYHAYIKQAVERLRGDDPVAITTKSQIPSSAGLGSSAALSVATVAALTALQGDEVTEERVAREAYAVELETQGGRASPTDTSASTHGDGVFVDPAPGDNHLWTIAEGDASWSLHHLDAPPLTMVVGTTGEKGRTAEQVAKVGRFVDWSGFARDVVEEIGDLTRDAAEALEAGDKETLGQLMTKNHRLLTILGVSTPTLDRLVEAAGATAYGAKLTGAGGGGSIIALTDEPDATVDVIKRHGGDAIVAQLGEPGVRVE